MSEQSSRPAREPDGRLAQWVCNRCGWTYDPVTGDPFSPIPPGIAFEDLPENWHCPNCGSEKGYFFP